MQRPLPNSKIFQIYWDNGLIQTCVDCQFAKLRKCNRGSPERISNIDSTKDDFIQDLCIILLTYDNAKMNDAHRNNHFNALITRIIQNNLFSRTSPYFKKYVKPMEREEQLDIRKINPVDPDTEE